MPSLQALEEFKSSFDSLGDELRILESLDLPHDDLPLPDHDPAAVPESLPENAVVDGADSGAVNDAGIVDENAGNIETPPPDGQEAGGTDFIDFGDLGDLLGGGTDSPIPEPDWKDEEADAGDVEAAPPELSAQEESLSDFIDKIPDDFSATETPSGLLDGLADEIEAAPAEEPIVEAPVETADGAAEDFGTEDFELPQIDDIAGEDFSTDELPADDFAVSDDSAPGDLSADDLPAEDFELPQIDDIAGEDFSADELPTDDFELPQIDDIAGEDFSADELPTDDFAVADDSAPGDLSAEDLSADELPTEDFELPQIDDIAGEDFSADELPTEDFAVADDSAPGDLSAEDLPTDDLPADDFELPQIDDIAGEDFSTDELPTDDFAVADDSAPDDLLAEDLSADELPTDDFELPPIDDIAREDFSADELPTDDFAVADDSAAGDLSADELPTDDLPAEEEFPDFDLDNSLELHGEDPLAPVADSAADDFGEALDIGDEDFAIPEDSFAAAPDGAERDFGSGADQDFSALDLGEFSDLNEGEQAADFGAEEASLDDIQDFETAGTADQAAGDGFDLGGEDFESGAVLEELPGDSFDNFEMSEEEEFGKGFGDDFAIPGIDTVFGEDSGLDDEVEEINLTNEELDRLQKTLSSYPLNLRIACQEIIAEMVVAPDKMSKFIKLLTSGASARETASLAGQIMDRTIPIPKGFEKMTGQALEEEQSSFAYIFIHNFLPVFRLFLMVALVVLSAGYLVWKFIYTPMRAEKIYKLGIERIEAGEYARANERFTEAYNIHQKKSWFYTYARAFRDARQYTLAEEKYQQLLFFTASRNKRRIPEKAAVLEYADLHTNYIGNYEAVR